MVLLRKTLRHTSILGWCGTLLSVLTGVVWLCCCCFLVLQKDVLEACDIDVALIGHGMQQDQEQAELFEIEW